MSLETVEGERKRSKRVEGEEKTATRLVVARLKDHHHALKNIYTLAMAALL